MADNDNPSIGTSKDDQLDLINKVDIAVKFLQNPKIQKTPLARQKAFLAKKGLTEEEITEALKRAGISDQKNGAEIEPYIRSHYPHGPMTNTFYRPTRLHNFGVAVIGGVFGYALGHLVKTYVIPYFFQSQSESNEKIDELQESVRELKDTLSETVCGIQGTLESVQKLLQEEQQQRVENMSLTLSSQSSIVPDGLTLSEVKSELSSIKRLFLNRQQFSSPNIQSSPIPSIPAWQRTGQINQATGGASIDTSDDSMLTTTKNGISGDDSSSDTIEVSGIESETGNEQESRDESLKEQSDSSFSTMSSSVGSPNLSLSEVKESLSETYVQVPTD